MNSTSLSRAIAFVLVAASLIFTPLVRSAPHFGAQASANVSFDPSTGLYTYSYTLASWGDSQLPIDEFRIVLRGATVLDISSPKGWSADISRDGHYLAWCACDPAGIVIPPNFVDDGRDLPSKYQIKPGQTLAGFSFRSPYPPSSGEFLANGWEPIQVEGVDFPVGTLQPVAPSFPDDQFRGSVAAPLKDDRLALGGRRPAVDAFVTFGGISDGALLQAPVIVDIVFGPYGEIVDQATFAATLNGTNVTSTFVRVATDRLRGYFAVAPGSRLKIGKNVLVTTAEGTVPGATRKAKDTDRLTFIVQ
jgi:hypothetical protein